MKNNNAQQNIPQGWKFDELGIFIADFGDGGTPSRSNGEYFGGEIPWVVIKDIKPIITKTQSTLTQKGLKNSSAKLWPTGTIILSFGATIGEVGIAGIPVATKQGIAGIVPTKELLNSFLYYLLLNNKGRLQQLSSGSTIKEVRPAVIKKQIKVFVPPIKEQQKIAEILGAVDEDIAKTQGVIEATEKLKKGLMQQLFTRGINHTKFKKTKLGEIPEEWKLTSLQEMIDNGIVVSHLDGNHGELYPKASEFIDNGVPYLSANCIEDGSVNFHKAKYLSLERASKFIKGVAVDGDILFAHNATVGPIAILKIKEKYVILSTTLTYYRCNEDKLVAAYLRYYMESDLFSDQYRRVMAQSTRNQVPITMQRTFLHILPKYAEQQKIAEILLAVDEKISINKKLKNKLILLKKGLMQDLLSGRVRVKFNE
ncbi:MAG: restriction endonuclease subunit S [Parcubacteria group bacterium]|jgi:type I restriction enzyme S subunit